MQDTLPQIPEILTRLKEHAEKAVHHLLPNAEQGEDGRLYSDSIVVNTQNWRFFDEHTKQGGELHQLWAYVKNQSIPDAKKDIDNFILNIDSPEGMVRFDFTPAQLSQPDRLYGERIEIFPEINIYAGTTTLLAGYNGSGKSTLATQIALHLSQYGIKAFILSPEMPPEVTAHILTRQATAIGEPTDQEWDRCSQHTRDNFYFSTIEDRITPAVAFGQMDNAYRNGCRLMIIDSLTCIHTGHELYQQADLADDLRAWSRSHPDAYLLVLAHMRKPSQYSGGKISRYDIRGAGEISDLAGHVWLLQRKDPFSQKEMTQFGDFDARLIVDKNRATGKLSCKMLRFSNIQKLFHATRQPPRYIDNILGENVRVLNRPQR